MDDQTKLALAMGWTHVPAVGPYAFIRWTVKDGEDIGLMNNIQPFDPFTDANDDYAVLEWMRAIAKKYNRGEHPEHVKMYEAYWELPKPQNYRIGDYARAALKVIEQGENGG